MKARLCDIFDGDEFLALNFEVVQVGFLKLLIGEGAVTFLSERLFPASYLYSMFAFKVFLKLIYP